jgi:hypothetical protein
MTLIQNRPYSENAMRALIIAWMILTVPALLGAWSERPSTLEVIKQWHLHTDHGDVRVKLTSASRRGNGHTVLSLEPEGDSMPTAGEEAGLLQGVLNEMSSLQHDPSQLGMISTWLQNSEFRGGIEDAISQSGKSESCAGLKYCHQAELVADQFLSSVDAFKEFDTVLKEYGLRRKAIHVDDLAVGRNSGRVLCQGLIVISLENAK